MQLYHIFIVIKKYNCEWKRHHSQPAHLKSSFLSLTSSKCLLALWLRFCHSVCNYFAGSWSHSQLKWRIWPAAFHHKGDTFMDFLFLRPPSTRAPKNRMRQGRGWERKERRVKCSGFGKRIQTLWFLSRFWALVHQILFSLPEICMNWTCLYLAQSKSHSKWY